jgi:hypothetical protein
VVPHPGQVFQKLGSGAAHWPHKGTSRVPARTAADWPQREQHARKRAQAPHRDWPVVLETMVGAVRPHMLQIAVLRGTQVAQTGPSALRLLTSRRRPQWMHCSRLTGSVTKHLAHNGFPVSSRAAGSRTVAQREQDTALALAVQLRQIRWPSRVLLKVTTRPQRGQAGR